MKLFILFLIFQFIFSYQPSDAVKYAKKYGEINNPKYITYDERENEDVNFVSQCLFAGGESFSGCRGKDRKGMIFYYNDLLECLRSKGWEERKTKDSDFKAGYPVLLFKDRHPMIAIGFEGDKTLYCGHRNNECNQTKKDEELIFLYKKNS